MTMELGLWRIDERPVRLAHSAVPLEKDLEDLIESDPDILGEPLLIVGRQVPTAYGKVLDLLAIDGDGALHAIELKRDKTPREATAQALDYGSWVQDLTYEDIATRFAQYRGSTFELAFADRFGVAPPDEINTSHVLTIVASDMDPATERIIAYLADYQVPINVAMFRHFVDGDRAYLARTWLLPEAQTSEARVPRRASAKEPWNGQDWYVSFGEESAIRSWDDARRYGFVSAGGGAWFSRSLRALPVAGRVFVYIPKAGYVAVGVVIGEARAFDEAVLTVDGEPRKMADLELAAGYRHAGSGPDRDEYVVPVSWIKTLDRTDAIREKGLFANQNSACKLRNRFTLDTLVQRFGLDE